MWLRVRLETLVDSQAAIASMASMRGQTCVRVENSKIDSAATPL